MLDKYSPLNDFRSLKIKFYINARTEVTEKSEEGLEIAKKTSEEVCDAITKDIKQLLENA